MANRFWPRVKTGGSRSERIDWKPYLKRVPTLIAVGVLIDVGITLWVAPAIRWDVVAHIPLDLLFFAVGLGLMPQIIRIGRVMIWSRFFGTPLSTFHALRIVFGTDLGGAVTPTALGGGPAKAALLTREGMPVGRSLAMTSLASIEDGIFFVISLPIALTFLTPGEVDPQVARWLGNLRPGLVVGGATVVIAAIGFFLWYRCRPGRTPTGGESRITRTLRQTCETLREVMSHGKTRLAFSLCLVAVQWTCRYSVIIVLARGSGVEVDPPLLFAFQILIQVGAAFVPAPGATGGVEAIFYFLHRGLFPASHMGILLGCWRALTFYVPVSLASIGFVWLENRLGARRTPTVVESARP